MYTETLGGGGAAGVTLMGHALVGRQASNQCQLPFKAGDNHGGKDHFSIVGSSGSGKP